MTEPEIKKSVQEMLNEAYNQAIDDAIGAVKNFYERLSGNCPETLIPELESLKKKP